jgi:hypothetical protein
MLSAPDTLLAEPEFAAVFEDVIIGVAAAADARSDELLIPEKGSVLEALSETVLADVESGMNPVAIQMLTVPKRTMRNTAKKLHFRLFIFWKAVLGPRFDWVLLISSYTLIHHY